MKPRNLTTLMAALCFILSHWMAHPVAAANPDLDKQAGDQGSVPVQLASGASRVRPPTIETLRGNPDIVVVNNVNYPVAQSEDGSSINWLTGEICDCADPGYHFNPWMSEGNLSFWWWGGNSSRAGVSGDGTTYAVLGAGDTIGPASTFISSGFPSGTPNWRQADNVDGFLGFRFDNEGTVNYGYVRLTTTGTTGFPATIVSYAYNSAGDPITIPGDLIFASRFDREFKDCLDCPTMVRIPGGIFTQGSPESEPESSNSERPQRQVNVPTFALGRTAVTFAQWDACVADYGCDYEPDDNGWGRGDRPVINVSWNDAQQFVTWLSNKTGHDYRLPSESEWEYATRAGTTGRFNTGDCITTSQANFRGTIPAQNCPFGIFRNQTLPAGSFAPNAFGIFDTHGNVSEWVQDCANSNYEGAPTDGSAWMSGDCLRAPLRGGAFASAGGVTRSALRIFEQHIQQSNRTGFRIARSIPPPLPAVSKNGLVDWFNPDRGLELDGDGQVVAWTNLADEDRSTGGSSAATTVGAANGRRMIRFNSPAAAGHLPYSSPDVHNLDEGYSVVVVFRLNEALDGGNPFPRLWRGADDSHAFFLRQSNPGVVEIKANPLAVADRPKHPFADGYDLGDVAILTARLTKRSQQLFFNGVMVDGSQSNIGAYIIDNMFQIGNSVRGDIGDVIVYDHTASLPDLANTGLALATAYGSPWPSMDCPDCPTMVTIPAGSFDQGSPEDEAGSFISERPLRTVTIPTFAMGQTAVTFAQWDACVADNGCDHQPDDNGFGRGSRPVIDVNWHDAQQYVTWLSNRTGRDYRLPSESEWEYATRAGTTGRFNTGNCINSNQANFAGTSAFDNCPLSSFPQETLPVGSFAPNAFGLYDTHGNVWERVQDCQNNSYNDAPTDGSAWMTGDCSRTVLRGGGWSSNGNNLRSARRDSALRSTRNTISGFRVASSIAQ